MFEVIKTVLGYSFSTRDDLPHHIRQYTEYFFSLGLLTATNEDILNYILPCSLMCYV